MQSAGLKGFEKVRAIAVCLVSFSVENGLLTASYKSKRPQLRECFRPQIDQMYGRLAKGERGVTMVVQHTQVLQEPSNGSKAAPPSKAGPPSKAANSGGDTKLANVV